MIQLLFFENDAGGDLYFHTVMSNLNWRSPTLRNRSVGDATRGCECRRNFRSRRVKIATMVYLLGELQAYSDEAVVRLER